MGQVFKIIFAILFAPVVYSAAVNFYHHLGVYPPEQCKFFQWGIYTFLFVFLFLHQFQRMYQAGQVAMMGIFKFIAPLDRPIVRIVPVYTAIVFIVLYTWNKFRDISAYAHYFFLFAGFFLCMHILLLAKELQTEETSFIKFSYLYSMGLYLVFIMAIVILLLDLVTWQFTFFQFSSNLFTDAREIYTTALGNILKG